MGWADAIRKRRRGRCLKHEVKSFRSCGSDKQQKDEEEKEREGRIRKVILSRKKSRQRHSSEEAGQAKK